jgi:hypothetical protein
MRDGGAVNLDSIISHFNECGGEMVLGAIKTKFADHNKHRSLDYWLRSNGARIPDQMQAESSLVEQLVGTGHFQAIVMACPDTGRQCKGLKLLQVPEDEEQKAASWLVGKFLEQGRGLPYANLNPHREYSGWVANFNVPLTDGTVLGLDLKRERDLFLLFVLASAWSRTGPWENAVYFVVWMKLFKKDSPALWLDDGFVQAEMESAPTSLRQTLEQCLDPTARKKISFRSDLYFSVRTLASHWHLILEQLRLMQQTQCYEDFFRFMRSIEGLGSGQKRMLIKIPLIMRELRCQLYPGIPGEYCCVPDARVYLAIKKMRIEHGLFIRLCAPYGGEIQNLLKASAKLYRLFGNLYDLPLFSYPDLKLNQ